MEFGHDSADSMRQILIILLLLFGRQVRKEDQMKINEFGRNNARLYEIREQKKALQDKLDTLDDANTELMMGEGDNVELFIGESFVETAEDAAGEYIEKLVEVSCINSFY